MNGEKRWKANMCFLLKIDNHFIDNRSYKMLEVIAIGMIMVIGAFVLYVILKILMRVYNYIQSPKNNKVTIAVEIY